MTNLFRFLAYRVTASKANTFVRKRSKSFQKLKIIGFLHDIAFLTALAEESEDPLKQSAESKAHESAGGEGKDPSGKQLGDYAGIVALLAL